MDLVTDPIHLRPSAVTADDELVPADIPLRRHACERAVVQSLLRRHPLP